MAQTLVLDGAQADGHQTGATERRSDLTSPRALLSLSSALVVCALVVLAVHYFRGSGPTAALWGASGVAVSGWLTGPRGREFDIAYGLLVTAAFAVGGFLVGNSLYQAFILTLASMIEVGAAVWMIRRFTPDLSAPSLGSVLKFLLVAPLIAPAVSGLVAAWAISSGSHYSFQDVFLCWLLGHGLGLAVICPMGLQLARGRVSWPRRIDLVTGGLILTALVVLALFHGERRPVGFLVSPLMLLAAVRLRLFGAGLALTVTAILAISAALYSHSLWITLLATSDPERVRLVQLYLVFTGLPSLPIAALLDERDRLALVAQTGKAAAEASSIGKSRLLANVSHEIKSPVAGIIGIGELWLAGRLGPVSPMQQEMAEMLVRTARQVEALAYDLLDVSNAEAGAVAVRLTRVELSAVLDDVRRTIAMRPEAHTLEILVEAGDDGVCARADSVRLTQVVTNLAVNAVKYGASGGQIRLKCERLGVERVRISVADKGPGIPLEKQSELFEPFNRLGMEKSTIEGNGIGLALAKRLTELQGGQIGFESRPGAGARFWVDLPAA